MPETLAGKQIIVAGATGGLGSATASLLAAEGALVIAGYRTSLSGQRSELPAVNRMVRADITQAEERTALLDAATALFGLVIFVGDPARTSDGATLSETLDRSYQINYKAPVLLAREGADRMRASGIAGSIVVLSSMQAVSLFAGSTAYASQKAALVHAARILAKECRGPANIRVNVVCPGVTGAGMARSSVASGKYDRFLREGAVPRWGRAEDIAFAVRFLLQPDSYITGQVLSVDGGLTL